MLPKVESQITIAHGKDIQIRGAPKEWLWWQPEMVKMLTDIIEKLRLIF